MKKTPAIVSVITLAALLVVATNPASAGTKIKKLSEVRWIITHQKQTGFGGQGKAIRTMYEKVAALCVIEGYKWFELQDTQSKGRSFGSAAAATFQIKLHMEEVMEDLNNCEALVTDQQMKQVKKELAKGNS